MSRPPNSRALLHGHPSLPTVRRGPIYAAAALLALIICGVFAFLPTTLDDEGIKVKLRDTSGTRPHIETGPDMAYRGKLWKNDRTVDRAVLGETPYARCDVHSVMSEDGSRVVHDWIFMEERDAVNVAVMTAEGGFAVFQQRKYAIPGETLSPVGGFIDDGETPFEAARREVKEELGLGSRRTLERVGRGELFAAKNDQARGGVGPAAAATASGGAAGRKGAATSVPQTTDATADGRVAEDETDWVFLGSYRTMANRGGGFIYTYLLKNAVPLAKGAGTSAFVGSGDDESQNILYLTMEELSAAVGRGEFKEVKWQATMALSLLHLKTGMTSGPT